MNTTAILALIAELYEGNAQLQAEVEHLRAENAALTSRLDESSPIGDD